jgi:2-methylcitrate dehydratase PrpD
MIQRLAPALPVDRLKTTLKIAEFVAGLSLDQVPTRAVEVVKGGIIDALGTAIAGTDTEAARVVTRWAREVGGGAHAGIIGGGFKASPQTAARVNGTIGQALDFDPPNPLLPVLLALGEFENSPGRDWLEAYIAGFEVQSKFQRGVSAKHYAHGWHSNAVFGTVAATAAAAKLLRLDAWQTCMAFGIAASEASGVRQNLGTMTKPYHAGAAAANGIIAATLARHGMTSASDSFEGEFGLLNVFATPGEYDARQIAETFGAPWDLLAHEIRIKPYPCCRAAHRALDAILALAVKHRIAPATVASIECEVSAHVAQLMAYPSATNALEAKFCLPYCLAVAVWDGQAGLKQFTHERVADARVQALAARVHVVHPEDKSEWETGTRLPCTVRIRCNDGSLLEESVGPPRGDLENPMSMNDIVAKYRRCTHGLLSEEHAATILRSIDRLESLADLRVLADILTFGICVKPAPELTRC